MNMDRKYVNATSNVPQGVGDKMRERLKRIRRGRATSLSATLNSSAGPPASSDSDDEWGITRIESPAAIRRSVSADTNSQRKLDQFNQCVKEMGVTLIDGQKNVVMSSFTKCTGDLRAMLEDRGVGKVETILSKIDDIVRTRLEKVMGDWRTRAEQDAYSDVQEFHKTQILTMQRDSNKTLSRVSEVTNKQVAAIKEKMQHFKSELKIAQTPSDKEVDLLARTSSAERLAAKQLEKTTSESHMFKAEKKIFSDKATIAEKASRVANRRQIEAEKELHQFKKTWEHEKERLTTRISVLEGTDNKEKKGNIMDYMMTSLKRTAMDDKHSLAKMREKSESVRAALAKLKESRAGVGSKEGAALSRSMSPVPESPATPPRAAMIANRRKARRASITELVGADLRIAIESSRDEVKQDGEDDEIKPSPSPAAAVALGGARRMRMRRLSVSDMMDARAAASLATGEHLASRIAQSKPDLARIFENIKTDLREGKPTGPGGSKARARRRGSLALQEATGGGGNGDLVARLAGRKRVATVSCGVQTDTKEGETEPTANAQPVTEVYRAVCSPAGRSAVGGQANAGQNNGLIAYTSGDQATRAENARLLKAKERAEAELKNVSEGLGKTCDTLREQGMHMATLKAAAEADAAALRNDIEVVRAKGKKFKNESKKLRAEIGDLKQAAATKALRAQDAPASDTVPRPEQMPSSHATPARVTDTPLRERRNLHDPSDSNPTRTLSRTVSQEPATKAWAAKPKADKAAAVRDRSRAESTIVEAELRVTREALAQARQSREIGRRNVRALQQDIERLQEEVSRHATIDRECQRREVKSATREAEARTEATNAQTACKALQEQLQQASQDVQLAQGSMNGGRGALTKLWGLVSEWLRQVGRDAEVHELREFLLLQEKNAFPGMQITFDVQDRSHAESNNTTWGIRPPRSGSVGPPSGSNTPPRRSTLVQQRSSPALVINGSRQLGASQLERPSVLSRKNQRRNNRPTSAASSNSQSSYSSSPSPYVRPQSASRRWRGVTRSTSDAQVIRVLNRGTQPRY